LNESLFYFDFQDLLFCEDAQLEEGKEKNKEIN
jgi:hypothetical protein